MSSDSTRDRSTERLLRTRLGAGRARPAPVTDDCVDAETLAAWSDRTLPADELKRIDTHLADCVRCQALLVTFAQTEPVLHAAVPFWRRWATQWLVPIGAMGAAGILVVIWTSTHQQSAQPSAPPAQVAQAPRRPEVIVPPVPPAVVPEPPAASVRKQVQPAEKGALAAPKKADAQGASRAEPAAAARPAPLPTAPPPPSAATRASPPPPLAAQPVLPPPQPQFPPITMTLPGAPPPATAANAATRARSSAGVVLDAVNVAENKTAADVIAEFAAGVKADTATSTLVAGAAGGRGGGGRGTGGGARAGAAAPARDAGVARQSEIATVAVRWRIRLDGSVEKTTTGGTTWNRINFNPPNPAVTGGVAPSAEVCWLIGRNGLVLRTTDGARFTPLTFPEAVDLRSIVAADGLHATVTTTDGRIFRTENGGLSWQLQESPPRPF